MSLCASGTPLVRLSFSSTKALIRGCHSAMRARQACTSSRGGTSRACASERSAGSLTLLPQRKEEARRVGLELERGKQRVGRGRAEQGLQRPCYALGAAGRERDAL